MVSKLIQIQIQVQIHPPWGPNLHHLIQGLSISTASKPSLDPYAACPDLISPSVVTLPPHWCVAQLSLKPALVTLESVISLVTMSEIIFTRHIITMCHLTTIPPLVDTGASGGWSPQYWPREELVASSRISTRS